MRGEGTIRQALADALFDCTSVLDVGCGPGAVYLAHLPATVTARCGLDAHRPYLEDVQPHCTVMHGDATVTLPAMPSKVFDGVMALDFIEHLEKPAAFRLLEQFKRLARRKVVIFTPEGMHAQNDKLPNAGRFTSAEWEWQTHRSAWEAEELAALGYTVQIWDFNYGKAEGMQRALWAVMEIPV